MNLISIETPRLMLVGFSPDDIKNIFDNDPKSKIMEMLGHHSEEDYLKEKYKHNNGYSSYNRSFLLFLLTEKESGKIIGRYGIHNWNKEDRRAEIGYIVHDEDYKNMGFLSEDVETIIDYGFAVLKINRLEAVVRVDNEPSNRLLEKNHFVKEGLIRQHSKVGYKFEDSLLYS